MTRRIIKNLELLKALHQCKGAEKQHFLKTARPELVNAICDCVHNILQGRVPISAYQKRALKSKKNILRQLTDRKKQDSSEKENTNAARRRVVKFRIGASSKDVSWSCVVDNENEWW